MSAAIAVLTPDPEDEGYHTRWREVLAETAAPLRSAGLDVVGVNWASGDPLQGFALVLPLLVWGYHRAGTRWRQAVTRWEAEGVRIANPPSVLSWNADKAYLGRLARVGAPVVPTIYVDRLSEHQLQKAAVVFGADRLIAKPQVSASAWQTIRWSPGAPLDGGPAGQAMIQPYLPAIETDGEFSLIYFDNRFSHAIRKRPRPGDFRVQPEYDGIITQYRPATDEIEAAEAILGCIEEKLLYARIDLVRGLDGAPVLMELELVEPDLYLQFDPERGRAFAEAVRRAAT